MGINLYTNLSSAHIGDIITYSADIYNGQGTGPIVCDASNIQASIVTPDGQNHPIPLVRTTLLNGERDYYPNIFTYTSRTEDVSADGTLKAKASDTGVIHQNDTNSQGGAHQAVNVTVTATPIIPPTPIPPVEPVVPPVIPVVITPEIVTPPPVTVNSSGGGGYYIPPPVVPTTTVAVVIVATSSIVLPATITNTTTFIPSFPNAGFPPQVKDIKWNTYLIPGIFISALAPFTMITSALTPKKNTGDGQIITKLEEMSSTQPIRLTIPKIQVDAKIELVGILPDGKMDVPKSPANVGWFYTNTSPGEIGSSVISGHSGWSYHLPAVFDDLRKLEKGDEIYVEDEVGTITTFVVRENRVYKEDDDPKEVFDSSDGQAHLNLITCSGRWNKEDKNYADRIVVFSDKIMGR